MEHIRLPPKRRRNNDPVPDTAPASASASTGRDPEDEQPNNNNNSNNNNDDDDDDDGNNVIDNNTEEEERMDALTTLRMLHNMKGPAEMSSAVRYMEIVVTSPDKNRTDVCNEFVSLHGLSILLFSLDKHQESLPFASAVIGLLCEVTCRDDRSGLAFVELGGVRIVLSAAERHPENPSISGDTMSILTNLNINEDSTHAVIGENCVAYCIRVMKKFPNDLHAQSAGARYFTEMSKIAESKESLINKQVDKLLLDAFHRFRGTPEYEYEQAITQESLARFFA